MRERETGEKERVTDRGKRGKITNTNKFQREDRGRRGRKDIKRDRGRKKQRKIKTGQGWTRESHRERKKEREKYMERGRYDRDKKDRKRGMVGERER